MIHFSRPTLVVQPLLWSDIDFPSWTWGFLATREFMQDIAPGEALPPAYGVAWYDYDRDVCVVMVIPLNVVAGAARVAWRWLRFPPWRRGVYRDQQAARAASAERYAAKQYDAGKRDGADEGYVRGWNACSVAADKAFAKLAAREAS